MQASVLTLVRGRETHLRNLMLGLACQTLPPAELVIAWMQAEPFADLPDPGCPVRHIEVEGDPMPLAAARNRAAEASTGELLVFLDVDCIPSPTLVDSYREAALGQDALFLGEVLYLPPEAVNGSLDYARLASIGRVHPAKPMVPESGVRYEPNASELWGLSFALPRSRYLAIGGMDESFVGYGGEETDFAIRAGATGLPFFWTGRARSYHQHHPVSIPPLRHFDHIVRNATLFHARHGRWCMDYWLGQFHDRGLIDWDDDHIQVRRLPTAAEIKAASLDDGRFFS